MKPNDTNDTAGKGKRVSILGSSPTEKMDMRSSAPQDTAVGGGSRPTKSKMDTEVSAPMNNHTMGRFKGDYLK